MQIKSSVRDYSVRETADLPSAVKGLAGGCRVFALADAVFT